MTSSPEQQPVAHVPFTPDTPEGFADQPQLDEGPCDGGRGIAPRPSPPNPYSEL